MTSQLNNKSYCQMRLIQLLVAAMNWEKTLRFAIDAFIRRRGMTRTAFGEAAVGDPSFVADLELGRSPQLNTADRVLEFMGLEPMGPAFRREVEAFLSVTRVKSSEFGRGVTGSPSFVTQLRHGASPRLATVDKARAWMRKHSNEAERRAVRAASSGQESKPQGAANGGHGMTDNPHQYMSTREVAALLGLSPRTLDRYRVSGDGPEFHKFGNRVRYLRADVEAWASKRRRRSTSDDGLSQETS